MMKRILFYSSLTMWYLLLANTTFAYTHADTLRGSNGRGRAWWDVRRYDLHLNFDTVSQSIQGYNIISFSIIKAPADSLQIDLQQPMQIDSVFIIEQYLLKRDIRKPEDTLIYTRIDYTREGNVWWLHHNFHKWAIGQNKQLLICYHGSPHKAVNPPWDGGFTWTRDSSGKQWIAVSCQGLGASVWWPCKDAQWDEPDNGMTISLQVPRRYKAVSNGRLTDTVMSADKRTITWQWQVKNPINNYDATFYIGDYVHWHDTLMGEKGKLDLDFWALRYNEERAKKQFAVVKQMIHCFEYWMGPYPFYEDGYKLVEAPYLGMEHQSAIAYGNNYKMGYKGFDRTGTGYGMDFDYIIVHESGHEWFGNNITARDEADMWVHEGLTTYSESLFTECLMGREKAMKYSKGERHNIQNDKPIIGDYGVNNEGSGDMYDKGASILYMIRVMAHDDDRFRMMLRGLGKEFYHQAVTTRQIEEYIAGHTGLDLKAFFNQYLRKADIPVLAYYLKDGALYYKFLNTVPGFTLPVEASSDERTITIRPVGAWQHLPWTGDAIKFSNDFLLKTKKQE